MRPVLFLNLDGVCHPVSMQYALLRGFPHAGPPHFCWSEPLRAVLEEWDATVVLRSTATTMYGLEPVKSLAPDWLRERIVGATGDVVRYLTLFEIRKVNTRFGVIRKYVTENRLAHWVAVEDDDDGWPADFSARRHLVECDSSMGLTGPKVVKRLHLAFAECRP